MSSGRRQERFEEASGIHQALSLPLDGGHCFYSALAGAVFLASSGSITVADCLLSTL